MWLPLLLLGLIWGSEAAQGPAVTPEKFSVQVQETVTVQEGLCAFVPCTFSYPAQNFADSDTVYGYWFRQGGRGEKDEPVASNNPDQNLWPVTQDSFHLVGNPQNFQCSLDIRDARASHGGRYFFQLRRGRLKHSYKNSSLTVQVTALTESPELIISGPLVPGHPRNLVCSVPWACDHATAPVISWVSVAHTTLGPRTPLTSVLTLTPQPQDNGTNVTCQVHFPGAGVTVEKTVQLSVSNPQIQLQENLMSLKYRSEKIRQMAGVVEGVIEGIGITLLLGVCLFLFFFLMRRRWMKKAKSEGDSAQLNKELGSHITASDLDTMAESQPGKESETLLSPAASGEEKEPTEEALVSAVALLRYPLTHDPLGAQSSSRTGSETSKSPPSWL
ncbi:myeloid cell surface antigen CD33-like [Erinaceus europaeus]|uniref:Myeloid cell surface antigen CD33-like n=1 Tax=Erinaceus europaeus TaxID=9365 RepID=A0ABM3X0P2_ERIEU|nr:myeloid cell surface antigen CD33-like [Erinaceus europaeus]XP_060042361.1 myeloid cell surface antigen CD33-like [Erinaceus europaeus]